MSEILFRGKTAPKAGKHEFNNVWVEGDLITSGSKYYIHPKSNRVRVEGELGKLIIMHEVVPETVGQYTGLKDITGKMIFTGDIVKVPDDYEEYGMAAGEIYAVYFAFGGFRLKPKHNKKARGFWLEDDGALEVIGNVHDNPELLR